MRYNQCVSLWLAMLVLGQAATLPQHLQYPQQLQQRVREDKKLVAKANATKKVGAGLDEMGSNRIEVRQIIIIIIRIASTDCSIGLFD